MAAIAPDAPIVGRGGRVDGDLREAGQRASDEVEEEEPHPTEPVLDVVPEDPQVEHVAPEMQPAAVQELAGQQGRRLHRQEPPVVPGRRQVGRDDAPGADEGVEGPVAAARHQPELPGERDDTGDDEGDRDEGRPPGRIGVPKRDHGARPVRASWSTSGSSWRACSRRGSRQNCPGLGSPRVRYRAPPSGSPG